ncbi:MAG: nitrilase-related carbon-nitrogen hydrolase [Candidatus Hodarchaeota archaeon]
MQDIKVAAVNFCAQFGDIKENLARTANWADRLSKQDVEIICFPELSISGYSSNREVNQFAQPIPGLITNELIKIAGEYDLSLLVGLPEKGKGGMLYISQVVINPEGLEGVYRKTILYPSEKGVFTKGNKVHIFKHQKITFGIQICYESRFSKVSDIQASKGAEIFFIPLASLANETIAKKRKRFLNYLEPKAYNNSCYVVCCNLIDKSKENVGVALIINPKGEVISEAVSKKEEAVIALLKGEARAHVL